ncbi:uncharacterized protein LOC130499218 isoform X2 [Raphanus sativus]|uniref:Uncharacterized protein LOC130499218 isoform X2 n=1 Tax=Raphanus sativus TaxID=3726 RepID=A0A9W3CCM2_RAPSA|nr:uncharacterized protein LOC130499218 isoform X2 [Raphanus sativus]
MGGGDTLKDEEEASSLYPDFSRSSSFCFSDCSGVSEETLSAYLRKREKTYQEILQSHDLLRERLGKNNRKLKIARRQILSYTPGSFADVNLSDYHVPKTTSILIVGPKGAGKSGLVNKITRVIQDDEFAPARAQESYGMPSNGGTFFVQEYMFPRRGSASFCLFDTRGLSQISSSDNTDMIEQWITKGVHHGEPVIWTSDDSDLKDRLIRDGCTGCDIRKVNSIIFVVNAVEMMESESSYAHIISSAFNCPLLSFKDDKPAVVITHGDILSREERARVQVLVGELLGIPPDKQIFDIPGVCITDSRDAATALAVCNLLRHCLEQADKNLRFFPKRNFTISKVEGGGKNKTRMTMFSIALTLFLALVIFCFNHEQGGQNVAHEARHELNVFQSPRLYNLTHEVQPKPTISVQNSESESEAVPNGEPSIDWRTARSTARRLWFDEGKVAKAEAAAEPTFDWRTTRRLWYVE